MTDTRPGTEMGWAPDAGGGRFTVEGEGLHAGTGLEMLMPDRSWQRVRFEVRFATEAELARINKAAPAGVWDLVCGCEGASRGVIRNARIAVLYMAIGHAWLGRFEVREEAGAWRVFDRKRGVIVTTAETEWDADWGENRTVYRELTSDRDTWPSRGGAVIEAEVLNSVYAGCPSVQFDAKPGAIYRLVRR